ncbi:MAG: glycoside hydrolase family 15 protein [Candidatus Omnitrophica bacterium]|nr:glycoside hydrolase family 15 protein [Candidatus Omnitrophota bacterium]
MDGSIDWCCLPHLDSPSVFGAILDCNKGGFFKIAPICKAVQKQVYLPESAVLATRFLSPEGVAEVIDYMPIDDDPKTPSNTNKIIRVVKGVTGTLRFKMRCEPAFNYGIDSHTITLERRGAIFKSTSGTMFGLRSEGQLKVVGSGVEREFTVKAGQEITFVFRHVEKNYLPRILEPVVGGKEYQFNRTLDFWRQWTKSVKYDGRWREMVKRSAITLKLLTFAPTGAIVAAPTTSLPEELGGVRNWDYRYTWIRDAAFTVYSFIRLGLISEAEEFMKFVGKRAKEEQKDGSLQIMYGIRGEHHLKEFTLDHLEGYRKSSPVRIGNGAYDQLQLDIYGELMDSVYLYDKYGQPISYELWGHLRKQLNYVCKNWNQKDEGIWEVRGGRQHFTYSKLMCWVALDRGIRMVRKRGFPSERENWYKVRDEIYEDIMTKAWSPKLQSFTQYYNSDILDAANLIMPLAHFISPTDPRMLSTIDAIMRDLTTDSLVYRYRTSSGASDGLTGSEGTFSMCTFWLVQCLTQAGRLREARYLFEKMLSYSNHLGLYAEEIGTSGEALGNFPQAFTHLSLISAASHLDEALG